MTQTLSCFRRFASRALTTGLIFAALTPLCSNAWSRDLQGRLGLGYNQQLVSDVPSVSLKYGFTRDLAGQLIFGANTRTPSRNGYGLKFFKNLFFETNLNFYMMGGAALVQANSQSGTEFLAGFGVEFFVPGLESLGFSFETGGSLNNLGGGYAFRTLGLSIINAGMHFYF